MPESGFIWPNSRSGEPTGNVTRTLQKLADTAKGPEFSLRDIRATGNTWLANEGFPERIRQHLMGHADGGPVITRYTKITADTEEQIRATAAVFDQIRCRGQRFIDLLAPSRQLAPDLQGTFRAL
jgi:integrase